MDSERHLSPPCSLSDKSPLCPAFIAAKDDSFSQRILPSERDLLKNNLQFLTGIKLVDAS